MGKGKIEVEETANIKQSRKVPIGKQKTSSNQKEKNIDQQRNNEVI